MEPWQIAAVAAGAFVAGFAIAFVLKSMSASETDEQKKAREIGVRYSNDAAFRAKVDALSAPPKPVKPSGEPLWLLAVLQREGRLLDFLLEPIDGYANEQIGAAVRDIHRQCHKAIQDHLTLERVMAKEEGDVVEVAAGFDPSAIRMTGNVAGQPPFKGTLRHHGWRVKELKLAKPPEGQDPFVVQPAEVEVA